jgi:hypothetical protein
MSFKKNDFKNKKYVLKKFKYFVDVDVPFYVCKMVEIHHQKNLWLHL